MEGKHTYHLHISHSHICG